MDQSINNKVTKKTFFLHFLTNIIIRISFCKVFFLVHKAKFKVLLIYSIPCISSVKLCHIFPVADRQHSPL